MVDIAASTATTATIAVGGFLDGTLERVDDHDWIRLNLAAGQTVEIQVLSSGLAPLVDSIMSLRNSAGVELFSNDDYGVHAQTFNSGMIWTAQTAGSYYIDVGSFKNSESGAYLVAVATAVQPPPLASLDWGSAVSDTNVTVFFAPAGIGFGGETSEGFNAYEKSRFQAAFDLIESVCGLTFTVVGTAAAADFKLVLDLNENDPVDPLLGYFSPPGEADAGVGVFFGSEWDRVAGGSLEAGGFDFVTIVHELLHGLGLAHPHDNGGSSTVMNGVQADFDDFGTFNLNQGIFTTMSYNTGYHTGGAGTLGDASEQFGYEYGPMALDIAMLQQKYGANLTTNSGANSYALTQVNADGAKWMSIWDSGGVDEIRNTGTKACVIDLRGATLTTATGGGGFISAVSGIAGGFTIAKWVVIENAFGGSGNDRLIGNSVANILNGGQGIDTLTGLGGNDTYVVHNPGDIIVEATGGGTADRVISVGSFALAVDDNIELLQTSNATGITALNLRGNWVAQTLIGNAGANRLDGLGGSDTIVGGAGGDVFVFSAALGLANIDRLTDYSVAADRIEIDNVAFIGLVNGALAASAFTANLTGVATDTLDRIIYETNTGFLWFDRDGSGAAFGRVQFADLAGSLAMTAGEFMVI